MRRDVYPKTLLARLSQPPRRPDVLRPSVASSRGPVDTLELHLALNDLDDACWLLDALECELKGRLRRKLRKRAAAESADRCDLPPGASVAH